MTNYTIGNQYTLPSLGKVYDKQINPQITLRSMTIEDEMKRLNHADRPYKVMCEIIDDCLIEKLGISSYDMCLGDYQFLLHKLRVVTYGKEYKLSIKCPYCGTESIEVIDLDSLKVSEYSDDLKELFEFDLPRAKNHITIQMQTPRSLEDIQTRAKEVLKKSSNKTDSAFLFTIMKLIKMVDGKVLNDFELENFCRNLEMMDVNYILKHADKLNERIGLDTSIDFTCDVCGLEHKDSFRITSEFFGPSYD